MASISSAGGELKLPIGESPRPVGPEITRELQEIYNALHISNGYLTVLREAIEGSNVQDPSQSMKFRSSFWLPAAVAIIPGNIVCVIGNLVYKGVGSTGPSVSGWAQNGGDAYNRNREDLGVRPRSFFVALTAAAPGEMVRVGVGPGILNVPGLTCGQLIWGKDYRDIRWGREANTVNGILVSQELTNDGNIYTSNPIRTLSFTGGMYQSEGQLIGWGNDPNWFGGLDYYCFFAFLHPIGVVVADNYLLISDYKTYPSPQYLTLFP